MRRITPKALARTRARGVVAGMPDHHHTPDASTRTPVSGREIVTPHSIVLGIMVVPANTVLRAASRKSWLPEAQNHATVRFVAGDVSCARALLAAEVAVYSDIVFVGSDDCSKWHSPAKVHAWYQFALRNFPKANWIAKTEDDGLLWMSAITTTLSSITRVFAHHRSSVYAGMMQWQGSCLTSEPRPNGTDQNCFGCWGGWYKGGYSAPRACGPWRADSRSSLSVGGYQCPAFRLSPFACGPFEARSRHLALNVARCDYARRYFELTSKRGDKIRDWCAKPRRSLTF